MSDPKRLVEEARGLGPEGRRLLEAGSELAPPPGAVDRGWSDFLSLNGIPPSDPGSGGGSGGSGPAPSNGAPVPAGGGGLGTTGALPLTSVVKTFSLGAALGVAAVLGVQGAARLGGSSEDARPRPAVTALRAPVSSAPPSPAAASATEPLAFAAPAALERAPDSARPAPGRPAEPPTPVAAGTELPPPGASVASFPVDAARESLLRAEARDIAEARAMIAGGRASEALVFLGRSSERFKDGTLGQEREVLIIEALVRSGQRAVAQRRGDEFLARNPRSPLAERVKGALK